MGSPPTPPPPYQAEPHPHAFYASPSSAPAPTPGPASGSQPPASSHLLDGKVPFPPPSSAPALPPQQPPVTSSLLDGKVPFRSPSPAPGSSLASGGVWLAPDPRSSSSQSLLPADSYSPTPSLSASSAVDPHGRRTLLVIYLHGFLGNDQSFRSFPAHVHALLTNMLVDSHVIHSKIYPRYKTYRSVDVARDNFSAWLAPHESATTDVILVGHSMGGILAADIVLMPDYNPYGQRLFKHRILGHVSLDCPFLGLHPGIIVSGIQSLFKPAPQPQDPSAPDNSSTAHLEGLNPVSPGTSTANLTPSQPSQAGYAPSIASSSSAPPAQADQFFNQPFFNDAAFREQPFVRRMLHFASKYRSEGLVQAAVKHMGSYLEFGGVLADLRGLESRYCRLRALEDVDELQPFGPGKDPRGPTTRVRFVNYYTLCTGRPKTPKPGTPQSEGSSEGEDEMEVSSLVEGLHHETTADEKDHLKPRFESPRPSITIEDHDRKGKSPAVEPTPGQNSGSKASEANIHHDSKNEDGVSVCSDMDRLSMQILDPTPMDEPSPMEEYTFKDKPVLKDESASYEKPIPVEDKSTPVEGSTPSESRDSIEQDFELDLAPIPDEPVQPVLPDPSIHTDKDARKQAEREAKRIQRAYDQAVKDRAKAIRERDKIIDKRRKKALKAAEKLAKEALKEAEKLERDAHKEAEKLEKDALRETEQKEKAARKEAERHESHEVKEKHRLEQEALRMQQEALRLQYDQIRQQQPAPSSQPPAVPESTIASPERTVASPTPSALPAAVPEAKPRKLRQFCNLPDPVPTPGGGMVRDRTWVDIFMANVDEVGAHCGLFMAGPHYERLVGDVGSRIVGWVQEDLTRRAILDIGVD
ncbi:hypothetical protein B0J13DRAFT_259043 [Dactylonectria estremocensis]|uniref:DUF676 domain-containing protein n=1 Tax=Dactylonectria estremocensis TaxID=1079267 RepID=A0A9P9F3I7_9HYPO|nr:hypothetical protein B0J13DRAFT_259043 [Dactylonectria estremocensis]